ncbi:hypothetical protein IKQ65_03005 [Candidatus Saccharibacteria bacterium]|nr:hypothetical protein [Candidatus Saccharibacteria bacterium]MBR6961970.1 hypothetical protein [Candidatus Saccharibacteria bacterium]
MKNTDIALVIMIALVSTVVSYFLGNALLGDPNERVVNVDYMDVIGSNVDEPDEESFNVDAINPTVEVYVGNCGPMEVWDANAKVCRSKMADDADSDKSKKEDASNTDDLLDDDTLSDDTVDTDTGE